MEPAQIRKLLVDLPIRTTLTLKFSDSHAATLLDLYDLIMAGIVFAEGTTLIKISKTGARGSWKRNQNRCITVDTTRDFHLETFIERLAHALEDITVIRPFVQSDQLCDGLPTILIQRDFANADQVYLYANTIGAIRDNGREPRVSVIIAFDNPDGLKGHALLTQDQLSDLLLP